VTTPACAVGRLAPDGPWVGFAPTLDDGYALVVGTEGRSDRSVADADDLVSLAVAYFEDALEAPPEDLAATHADIGSLVRHLAESEAREDVRRRLAEGVDAVDDGLAADVVVGRLTACLEGGEDPLARLRRRATEMLSG
jgi:hypothetical protein